MCTWAHICKESTGPLRTKVPVSLLLSSIAELKRPSRKRPPPSPPLSFYPVGRAGSRGLGAGERGAKKWREATTGFPEKISQWIWKGIFSDLSLTSDGEKKRISVMSFEWVTERGGEKKKRLLHSGKKLGKKDRKKCWENWSIGGGGRSGWFLYHQERKLRFSRRDGGKYFLYFCWQKKKDQNHDEKVVEAFVTKKVKFYLVTWSETAQM